MTNQAVEHLLTENLVNTADLESLIRGYLLNCRSQNLSPHTIDGYRMFLRNFAWYCVRNDFPHPQKITTSHLQNFLWYLGSESHRWNSTSPAAQRIVSSTTVNDYFRALRTFFKWLEKEAFVLDNPFKRLKAPKVDKKIIQALTTSEIEQLFKTCSGTTMLEHRNRAILSIFLDTGLRVSEMTALIIKDVNMEDGSILVRRGKGGKQRIVRIGNRAQKTLWRYVTLYRKGNGNRLFLNRDGEPLELIGMKILIKRMGLKAGIKLHPHQLRHTFAISFLRAGGDVFSLQYLLGHSTLNMTQRYLQSLNAEDAANAHRKFSPLDNM